MARAKKASRLLVQADQRLSSIESIDPQVDLGDGLTAPYFRDRISDVRYKLAAYNRALASLDGLYKDFLAAERELADLYEKVLLGVAYKYGKNSQEYVMAGGVRKVDRKRPVRRDSEPIVST
jgi:hypothetical protein